MAVATPAKYAIARDGRTWQGMLDGLEPGADGGLRLTALAAPANGQPVVHPAPGDGLVHGLAVAVDGAIAEADAPRGVIEVVWPGCSTPLGFALAAPGPLAWGARGELAAVERASRSIVVFERSDGGILQRWTAPFSDPIGLASDSEGRFLVLDAKPPYLHRLDARGRPDVAFRAAVDGAAGGDAIAKPVAIAIGALDWVIVADADHGLLVFDDRGVPLGAIAAPVAPSDLGVITANGTRMFVHDRSSGLVHAFGIVEARWLGTLPHWSGSLAALAVAADGVLWLKPEAALSRVPFEAAGAHVPAGRLWFGPLDAGRGQAWQRLRVEAERAADTTLSVWVATTPAGAVAPPVADYSLMEPNDANIGPRPAESDPAEGAPPLPATPEAAPSWLWVRVEFSTRRPSHSPVLHQLSASTRGEAFFDHLPQVYAEKAASGSFLDRLCDVLGLGVTSASEAALAWGAAMAPDTAPEERLGVLAQWIDAALPTWADAATQRELIRLALRRHLARGTLAGLVDEIALTSGVPVHIREAFLDRRIWRLDAGSGLGFDTRLPAVDPETAEAGGELQIGHPCPPVFPSSLANNTVSGPSQGYGAAQFADTAHRFMVIVPARTDEAAIDQVASVAGRDRPAHTVFGVCSAPDGVRLGVGQMLLDDARGAFGMRLREHVPLPLDDWRLGHTSRLADPPTRATPALLTLDGSPLAGGPDHGG